MGTIPCCLWLLIGSRFRKLNNESKAFAMHQKSKVDPVVRPGLREVKLW